MASPFDLRKFVGGPGAPGDLSRILKVVGEMAISDAQKNFDDQSFNGDAWPRRYPNQSPFKVNVAGVVSDLASGGNISQRRFDARPAGLDTGNLRASISSKKIGPTAIEVGSALPYADRFNSGRGTSSQLVTKSVKQRLTELLEKRKPTRRTEGQKEKLAILKARSRKIKEEAQDLKSKIEAGTLDKEQVKQIRLKLKNERLKVKEEREAITGKRKTLRKAQIDVLRQSVGFLFQIDELVTKSPQRQFIGKTPKLEKDIAKLVELVIEGRI